MSNYRDGSKYRAHVTHQQLGETSKSKPQFILTFMIDGEINPEDPDGAMWNVDNLERSYYKVINEKTIKYLMEDLERLGFQGASFEQLDEKSPGFHSFIGQSIVVVCKHGEYNGKPTEQFSLAGAPRKSMAKEEVKKLDALFGANLRGKFSKPAQAAKPAETTTERPNESPGEEHPAEKSDEDAPY